MSGSGVCEVYGQAYKMELAVYHGNITTLHTQDFTPQGNDIHMCAITFFIFNSIAAEYMYSYCTCYVCVNVNVYFLSCVYLLLVLIFHVHVHLGAVAVVNSKECLIWLEQVLHSLWIPGGDTPPPYLGLPLVILALEDLMMDSECQYSRLCHIHVQCHVLLPSALARGK